MKKLLATLLCAVLFCQSAAALDLPGIAQAAQSIAILASDAENWGYNYSAPVPEGLSYTDEVFENSLFLGNSLAEGFRAFSGIKSGQHKTAVGMTVSSAEKYASFARGKDRVYLMLGINEIGQLPQRITENYAGLIHKLRQAEPNAQIYVQSLLPVYEPALSSSQKNYGITNSAISRLNNALQTMCAENQLYYLDIHSALADENGALPGSLSWDGVHLTPEAYGIWLDYLKNHIAP